MLTNEAVPIGVRQAGAVFFKNLVKVHWEPADEQTFGIPDAVKVQVVARVPPPQKKPHPRSRVSNPRPGRSGLAARIPPMYSTSSEQVFVAYGTRV